MERDYTDFGYRSSDHSEYSMFSGCLSKLLVAGVFFLIVIVGVGISRCSFNMKEEVEFSYSVKENNPVYVDSVSIVPDYVVTRDNVVSCVVCKCVTDDGSKVWVSMSTTEYKDYFDSKAKFSSYSGGSFEELEFSKPVRIHGKSVKAEGVCDGLSKSIGKTMMISFISKDT